MSEQRMHLMDAQPDNDIELGPMRRVTSFHSPPDTDSAYNSTRSSLDESYYEKQHCDVQIYDDVSINLEATTENLNDQSEAQACHRTSESARIFPLSSDASSTSTSNIPERLRTRLKVLDPSSFKAYYD